MDFVNDPFINELLPNIIKYNSLARDKEYQRHAFEKSKEIIQQLRDLSKKSLKSLQLNNNENVGNKNNNEMSQLEKGGGGGGHRATFNENDYKRYKELRPESKIQCLFSPEEHEQIESEFLKMSRSSE